MKDKIYLIDVVRHRSFYVDDGCWYQRISFRFAKANNEVILTEDKVEIPREDHKQIDLTLKEPIFIKDIVNGFDSLIEAFNKEKEDNV